MTTRNPRKRRFARLHDIIYGDGTRNSFPDTAAYLQRSSSAAQDVRDYISSGSISYMVGIHKITNQKLFHLDAADSDTITLSGSDNISSWSDKEGNKTVAFVGNIVTSYPQRQLSSINNKNVPSFTVLNTLSSSFKYTNADNLFFKSGTTSQARSYFAVVKSEKNDNMGYVMHTGQNFGYSFTVQELSNNRMIGCLLHDSGAASLQVIDSIAGTTVVSGTSYVFGFVYNGGTVTSSGSWTLYNSKASGSTPTLLNNNGFTSASVGDALYVGSIAASGSTNKNMSGSVHEVLIYSGALSNTDSLTVMRALASKWGVTLS